MTPLNNTAKRLFPYIVIGLIILFCFLTCESFIKPTIIKGLGGYTNREVKETIDTISIKYDSIRYKYDSIRLVPDKIVEPRIEYIYKSSNGNTRQSSIKGEKLSNSDNLNTSLIDSVYTYFQPISDTLIEGKIRTDISITNSKIINQELLYKPKFPIFIKKTITIEKTKEVTLSNEKAHIGVGISAHSDNKLGILGVYQTKKYWQFQGGYNWNSKSVIPSNQTSATFSIGVIKLF